MGLVERKTQLDLLGSFLGDAVRGEGRVAFVGGEAGAGKSALLGEFCASLGPDLPSLWGVCEPLSSPRPLGPLADIAPRLGGGVAELIRQGDRTGTFDASLAALASGASARVVVFEDIHWADESTFDLLQFLARRIASTRVLLVATFRDDTLGRSSALAVLLGDLASVPAVRRVSVPPLSLVGVRCLASGSSVDPEALYRDTAGNAFFVTEILSNNAARIPATVTEAILARVARLPNEVRQTLEAAAVVGSRIEPSSVLRVGGVEPSHLDACVEAGLLNFDSGSHVFRHELARQAVLGAIPPSRRAALHAEVLGQLRALPPDMVSLARLAEHAELAGDRDAVLEFAPAAGISAAALGSHREGAFQYGRALRFADGGSSRERAGLLERRAYECYLIDDLADAIDARRQAVGLWRELGELARVGDNLRQLSRLYWVFGKRALADESAFEAIAILEQLPPGPELAMAYANQCTLRMVAEDPEGCQSWGCKAVDLATRLDDAGTLVHTLISMGTARFRTGDRGGETVLKEGLALALGAGLEDEVCRAYSNLAAVASERLDLAAGESYTRDGIAYCLDHDLSSPAFCLQGGLLTTLLSTGRWEAAAEGAVAFLASASSRISRISGLVVLARVRVRRGDPEIWPLLDEALSLAKSTTELQWLGPVAAARAEARWLDGQVDRVAAEVTETFDLAVGLGNAWSMGELGWWLWRCGELTELPSGSLEPFARHVGGDPVGAAELWAELGFPYESALARADSPDETDVRAAIAGLDDLGARPARDYAVGRLRALGAGNIPRGRRSSTRANPAGLTSREVEVLRLVEQGMSDAEIANVMFVSARTVSHHVSAILSKLEVGSRRQAAELARQLLDVPALPA